MLLGGVYADMDMECLRSIGPALEGHHMVVGIEEYDRLSNAIMASIPQHPLLWRILAIIAKLSCEMESY